MRRVVWFSCGVASAAAAKLAVEKYGDDCVVASCDTRNSEHSDNYRFSREAEAWLGREIVYLRSSRYVSVDDVIEKRRYMAGVAGALCTVELKKFPREAWQRHDDVHIFGYTAEEARRAARFEENNPALAVEWILIDLGMTKAQCHDLVSSAGIALPEMYRLGYEHNNCPGCVKSQSPGYWNKIRRDFPEVFARRVRQSRLLGVRLVKVGGVRVFLDELPEAEDAPQDDIDCGPVCQLPLNFQGAA